MRRELRLASSPAGARLRLARLRASAQRLVDVRNAYPEHRGGSINSHPTIDRRHYSLTQILGVRSSHRDPRVRIKSRIRNHRTVPPRTPSDSAKREFALAAAAATIGPIIPPSITMVLYAM